MSAQNNNVLENATANVPLVEMARISKSFGPIQAVCDASFEVWPAEVIGLVGDNAAGKSTLMKVLSGAHEPTAGEIRIDGEQRAFSSPHDARERGIEMVYQDFALVPQLDIASNIFLGREPLRKGLGRVVGMVDRSLTARESRALFQRLHVDIGSPRAKTATLSGGQQQAVAIARAMAFQSRLIIMDEPTANLSVAGVEMVRKVIQGLKAQRIAVLIISHRLEDVFAVADRVLVMKRGRLVAERAISDTHADEVLGLIVAGSDPRAVEQKEEDR